MLLNVKKMKKHIAIFAIVAIVAIAGIGTTISALAAENTPNLGILPIEKAETVSPKGIEEIPMAPEPLAEKVTTLSSETVDGTLPIYTMQEVLLSLNLSDESKFTPEQWQDILKKIESGEITLETE